uniref:NADH-ubiquinone oxidoreductase chain 6 n=1 Tax=Bisnius sordidus TaxID=877869 RepID=A0A0S2M6S7_9COLE|nr:NADH deshydrogenase subunit 6 [Bisnius sordidus]
MMMLIINLILSITFIFLKHPMTMGTSLLMQTLMITLLTGILNMNFWFSYILFLIMIGGMLILFIYMTSIASNEKFKFSILLTLMMMTLFTIMIIIYLMMDKNFIMSASFSKSFNESYELSFNMIKFFNYPSNIILFMMIIYLFITLIAVVKITDIKFGPLRQTS